MAIIEEGKHKVQGLVDVGVGKSAQKGTHYYFLRLKLETNEETNFIQYLTEATKERALKTLLDAGFIGKKLSDLASPSALDLFVPVEGLVADIGHETFTNDKGEDITVAKVKWLNSGNGIDKFEHAQAVQEFSGLSFDGELMKLRKTHTMPQAKPQVDPEDGVEYDDSINDLPF